MSFQFNFNLVLQVTEPLSLVFLYLSSIQSWYELQYVINGFKAFPLVNIVNVNEAQ